MAVDMAGFPSAPDHSFSQMTPRDVQSWTSSWAHERPSTPMRPEKTRQDSAMEIRAEKHQPQVWNPNDADENSVISKSDDSSPVSHKSHQSAGGPHVVDINPADMAPGSRLSRPFMMPDPVIDLRGSGMITRCSVVSVELITDFVKSRRVIRDGDPPSPDSLSPSELQNLSEYCILKQSALFENTAQPTMQHVSRLTDLVSTGPPVTLRRSRETAGSPTQQRSKAYLQQKCSLLEQDREGFARSVDGANKMLAATKERLYRAKKDLYIREEHVREIETRATNMKKGMEEAMRTYSSTSKQLASLKDFRGECSPSVPAQLLSMCQRKLHGELKVQLRDLERKLSTAMAELRCMEKKWKEAQRALVNCTQDLEKQKSIVSDKTEELRRAEEGQASSVQMLERAEQEVQSTKEQLTAAEQDEGPAVECMGRR